MIPGVPKNFYRAALAAFVGELQNSAAFRNGRIVKCWQLWNGSGPNGTPTVDMMPVVQLRWLAGDAKRIASTRAVGGPPTSVTEIRPKVHVDLWTAGTDQNDALDLSALIYDALAPQDRAEREAMTARFARVGIRDWRLDRLIAPPSPESFTQASIMSSGSYELTIIMAS